MRNTKKLFFINTVVILLLSILTYNTPYKYLEFSLITSAMLYCLFWIVISIIIRKRNLIIDRKGIWLSFIPNFVVTLFLFILGFISHLGFIFNLLGTATLASTVFLPITVELMTKINKID